MNIFKFYANWCGPCNQLNSELEGTDLDITPVNIDDVNNYDLVKKYNIKKIPFVVFADKDGNVLKRLSKGSGDSLTRERIESEYNKLKMKSDGTI